ncbi:hypothetical protein GTY65_39935 [Streptomyces sp. SID8379]|uniref:hypothetical protein n=1 Tax=unclassified Streptomyces TaxID=2593676 RepID=UPI000360B5BD|nr:MULTISPECIES: hypothetical protein [unclassified Streptomyces]MYW70181.1 hypothetical protein [Streptomyces sp. SID8379]
MAVDQVLNPWARATRSAPYAVPEDLPHLQALAETEGGSRATYRLDLTLPPEPFSGLHHAPLVMLLANPGVRDGDPAAYARPGVTERTLQNIANAGGTPNHFLTDADKEHPGRLWWSRILNDLTKQGYSVDELSRKLLAVQFHGYHSRAWRPIPYTLPSQSFAFHLVRRAIARNAVIVLGRIADTWRIAVPELASYPNVVTPKSPRNAVISRGNFSPEDFERIEHALQS